MRLCRWCHHLFESTAKTASSTACLSCGASDRGWSVGVENAKPDELVSLIPSLLSMILDLQRQVKQR